MPATCPPCCSVGKILRLRQKITSIKDSVTGLFMGGTSKDASSEKLDAFKGKGRGALLLAGCWLAGWAAGWAPHSLLHVCLAFRLFYE